MAKYAQLTNPSFEPITLAGVKAHLRLDTTADDTLIESTIIPGVRDFAERHTGTVIPLRTFRAIFDTVNKARFSPELFEWWDGVREGAIVSTDMLRELELPLPPLVSIESVTTTNSAGETSAYASENYYADIYSEPGKLILKQGRFWPSDLRKDNCVTVDFTAGYANGSIPPMLKIALMQIAAHWYENRELFEVGTILARVPVSALSILDRFKVRRL
jgi:hypothetical protein